MSHNQAPLTNPKAIAENGERIYRERYKEEYERDHVGKYVAINVRTETATLGDSPEETLAAASKKEPGGLFHLIRIGFPGVYSVSYARNHGPQDWIFGR